MDKVCEIDKCSNIIHNANPRRKYCDKCILERRAERQRGYTRGKHIEDELEDDTPREKNTKEPVPDFMRLFLDQIASGERPSPIRRKPQYYGGMQ